MSEVLAGRPDGQADQDDRAAGLTYDDEPVDPEALGPACGPEQYEVLVAEIVAESRPRLFAVFRDIGERVDGEVAAWGLDFGDHVQIVGCDGVPRTPWRSAEAALGSCGRGRGVTARVVWADPAA